MKNHELPKLTPPEFEIMDAVWQAGELTATEIMNHVNSGKEKELKRTTIQVQVNRLEEKGWLSHREDGNKFLFTATVPRHEASAAIAVDIKERIFGGSCVELVRSLFANSDISPEEIRKLREFIDKYEE
ncbi:MAG: BlaI/MecI/CopY family transcriptional regulator [Victivallaceae bacterium]